MEKIKTFFTSLDYKKFLRWQYILIASCLIISLTLTLVFCTKKDGDEGKDDQPPVSGEENDQQPDNNDDTPEIPETPDQGGGENNDPTGGDIDLGGGDDPTPDPTPEPTPEPDDDPASLTYAEYSAMTPAEKQEHFNKFASTADYLAWYNKALAEHENQGGGSETGGDIDLGGK